MVVTCHKVPFKDKIWHASCLLQRLLWGNNINTLVYSTALEYIREMKVRKKKRQHQGFTLLSQDMFKVTSVNPQNHFSLHHVFYVSKNKVWVWLYKLLNFHICGSLSWYFFILFYFYFWWNLFTVWKENESENSIWGEGFEITSPLSFPCQRNT